MRIEITTIAAVALGGCAAVDVPMTAPPVALVNSAGQAIGSVTASQTSGGVTLTIIASGLPHGLHGLHVHNVGRCDPPGFDSAGSHWNPASKLHGFNNPQGPHSGDLPNLTVSSSGVARETAVLAGASEPPYSAPTKPIDISPKLGSPRGTIRKSQWP